MSNAKPIIGLITDTHLTNDNASTVISVFREFIENLCQLKINIAIHCGDWFTDRFGQSVYRLLVIKEIINLFRDYKIMLLTIPGNHDKQDHDTPWSYLHVYEDVNNPYFHIYDKAGKWSLPEYGIRLHFIPFFPEGKLYLQQLVEAKKHVDPLMHNVLFTHVAINGVRNNDGSLVTEGIPPSLFKAFDKVFVGHYHDESLIEGFIHYFSSSHQANYGEDEYKGFTILYSDLTIEKLVANFTKLKKVKVEISDKEKVAALLEDIRTNNEDVKVRVVFCGSQQEIEGMSNTVQVFKDLGVDVKWENNKELVVDYKKVEQAVFEVQNAATITKNWVQYCIENKLPPAIRTSGLKRLKQL